MTAEREMVTVPREVLENLVNAKALSGVRALVAGWNGEDRDAPHEPHPARLGATLPKTNCGAVYELDRALQAARTALSHSDVVLAGGGVQGSIATKQESCPESADLPATSEDMDVTAGETAPNLKSDGGVEGHAGSDGSESSRVTLMPCGGDRETGNLWATPCPAGIKPGPSDQPVIIRRNPDDTVDEICAEACSVHIEQMDGNSFYIGITAKDGSYHQFWLGARNRKSLVDVRHTESSPAVAETDAVAPENAGLVCGAAKESN